jgi:hypothetical protein
LAAGFVVVGCVFPALKGEEEEEGGIESAQSNDDDHLMVEIIGRVIVNELNERGQPN